MSLFLLVTVSEVEINLQRIIITHHIYVLTSFCKPCWVLLFMCIIQIIIYKLCKPCWMKLVQCWYILPKGWHMLWCLGWLSFPEVLGGTIYFNQFIFIFRYFEIYVVQVGNINIQGICIYIYNIKFHIWYLCESNCHWKHLLWPKILSSYLG